MSMDPMAMQNMQNMMMNGGFGGGVGMNGMNMDMGMGGFDGGVGAGFNIGWNGQQSWNVAQDNFNHPNAAGIGHVDYASNNSGYNSHSTGYNQGNYGRGNQYNDYQNNSYGYRGRGRGRGYGRGGYGYGSNDQFSQHAPQQLGPGGPTHGPISETGSIPMGPKADAAEVPTGDVDEFGRERRHATESKDVAESDAPDPQKDENDANGTTEVGENVEVDGDAKELPADIEETTPKPIQTLDEAQAASYQPNGHYAQSSRGGFNLGFHGRGASFSNMQSSFVKPVDVPINAPTGPKAMREGLPNTGLSSLRGRGFSIVGRANPAPRINGSASIAPEPNYSEKDGKERERTRSPSRERSKSRDRKRSRSGDRQSRRHRHRSTSVTEDEKETERRRQRRRERRRHHEEGDDREDYLSSEKLADDDSKLDRVEEERSRSASPSDSKRSSHRSRREKDKYRERDRDDRDKYRERDDDREHKASHKHRSSRRHHDDRSRSRDRSRDRDREHRHRHSRRASEEFDDKADKSVPPTPIETEDPSRRLSVVPSGAMGIEIKGASSRRNNPVVEEIAIPTGPRSDRTAFRERENEKPSRHREDDDSRHRSSRHRDSDREREKEREKAKEKERPRAAPTAPAVQDPHTLEREARNRERLVREAQRIAGLTGGMPGARKRSRDDGEDLNGRKGRKKRGRGGEESEEARVARLEAERESARWS